MVTTPPSPYSMPSETSPEPESWSLSRDAMTLSRHVLQHFDDEFTADAKVFSALMSRMALAGKMIARRLGRAGLIEDTLGVAGTVNIQGEEQKQMDVYANQAFLRVLEQTGLVCRIVSEEMEVPTRLPENCALSRYAVLVDPLDGSSNIDADLTVGSIFSVLQAEGLNEDDQDLLQPGSAQIASGYILYGPSTQLIYSLGRGVHSFTLDPSLGEFILTQTDIQMPRQGSIYSTNEGNFSHWSDGVRHYVQSVPRQKGYASRYSGALVADVHRILLQGGVYLYPGTDKSPEGKLRLMYEASPLAFLIEQAGGRATTGYERILDIQPTVLHQRVPLIIGSSENVAEVEQFFVAH